MKISKIIIWHNGTVKKNFNIKNINPKKTHEVKVMIMGKFASIDKAPSTNKIVKLLKVIKYFESSEIKF